MIIPTAIECLCCSEITEMMNKRSTEEVGCITLHPGFQSVCLNSSFNSIFTILLSIAIGTMRFGEPMYSSKHFETPGEE